MKKVTLCFLIDEKEGKILLAMKKRGFGEGKLNGAGGKLEQGETHEMAVAREVEEEIGVRVRQEFLERVAHLTFHFHKKAEWDMECVVFITRQWEGEPHETEEMRPAWYAFDAIPFDLMWIDDRHWLPLVLEGKSITATFHFNESGDRILRHAIDTV